MPFDKLSLDELSCRGYLKKLKERKKRKKLVECFVYLFSSK